MARTKRVVPRRTLAPRLTGRIIPGLGDAPGDEEKRKAREDYLALRAPAKAKRNEAIAEYFVENAPAKEAFGRRLLELRQQHIYDVEQQRAAVDPRIPRSRRLASFPTEFLMRPVMRWFFSEDTVLIFDRSVLPFLFELVARKVPNAEWFLNVVTRMGAGRQDRHLNKVLGHKSGRRYSSPSFVPPDQHELARPRALLDLADGEEDGEEDDAKMLKALLEMLAEFQSTAISRWWGDLEDVDENEELLQQLISILNARSEHADDITATAMLANYARVTGDSKKQESLFEKVARLGDEDSMLEFADILANRGDNLGAAHMLGEALWFNRHVPDRQWVYHMERSFKAKRADDDSLEALFILGRNIQGIDEDEPYGFERWLVRPWMTTCIELYLETSHRARRAALQTVVAMQECGLPRDVARMIGRRVYGSRSTPSIWNDARLRKRPVAPRKAKK